MIEAKGLTKRYGGTVAVDDLSFTGALAALLTARGATVTRQDGDTLAVTGTTVEAVGELARTAGFTLTGLAAHQATLEDRYMELTRDAADYQAAATRNGERR
jgi:ABC-2 type transport system ATP-binding protein